ncbi:Sporulation integral membrane protein YlbJ OS=Lysinibacillus sphaericus OX=1421 GN=ylbJ PE=4 SV=1 [Lysinibacillus sphaericus]
MEALFPYLLPYLILTQWLLRLTAPMRAKTKRISLYVQAYLISALGGYPTAIPIVYLKNSGQLHLKEANFLLAVCHAPSPLFYLRFCQP